MTYSSNSFANGANQNCGNVLSDRSSTRRIAAPGGNSTIVLGSEQLENATSDQIFEEEAKNTSAAVKCTPGGNSSIGDLLGGEAPALGGEVTGKLTSSNCFASGSNPNSGNMLTERPSTRLRCAPGGESSIGDLLGQEAPALGNEVTGKLTSNSFANGANPNAGNVLTDRSSTRLHCPPGGIATITLGGDEQEVLCKTDSTRIAPGGVSTIQLGVNAVDETSVAEVSGNRVAPGGVSTIILGGGPPLEIPSARTAPGGVASVVLGDAPSSEQFSHRELEVVLDAPEPTARFPCAPGGNSTLVFGASDEPTLETATRVAPGGPSSIVLGGDAVSLETSSTFRIAPGGEATIVLGDEASTDRFTHRHDNQVKTEVPDACPRFPCAPGGTSTIELTSESTPGQVTNQPSGRVAPGGTSTIILGGVSSPIETSSAIRTAPGGEATISLGEDASADRFMHRKEEPRTTVPDPCPRFPCAPGGNSTIELNTESSSAGCELPSGRVAPGGNSTIVLGGESSSDILSNGACTRGPVGGETSILLGEVTETERFLHRETKGDVGAEVPEAAPRFPCAPGGHATIDLTSENLPPQDEPLQTGRIAPGGQSSVILGGDLLPNEVRPVNANAIAPGGNATVVLGSDAPAERFNHREAELSIEVPDPTPRFPCAPGGNSTVVLGNDEEMKRPSLTDKVTRAANVADENMNIANIPQASVSNEIKIQPGYPSAVLG